MANEIEVNQENEIAELLGDDTQITETTPPSDNLFEEIENEQKGEEATDNGKQEVAESLVDVENKEGDPTPAAEVKEEVIVEETKEPNEVDLIKEQNAILMKRIEELSEKIIKPTEVKEEVPTTAHEVLDFIGEDDIDDVMSSKELFNKMISKVVQLTEERTMQKVLVSIPSIVMRQTQQQNAITEATRSFYEKNPDLEAVKKTVAAVANEIYSTDPQLSIADIFEKSAIKTREILGLRNRAVEQINEKGRSPEFAKVPGSREKNKVPSLDKFQQELNDLLNF